METNTTIEPYALQYYIAKYGTVENLTNDYIGAIDGLRMQYKQYEDNPRKGGRYRREKMERIRQQAEAIYDELLRVSRAMKEYFATRASETPRISTETAETVNVSAEGEKEAETKETPQIFNCEWQTIEHFKAIPNIAKLAKAGIIINGVAWHTEYLDKAHKVLARVDNLGWHDDGKGFGGFQGSGVFGKTAIFKSWDNAVIATIDALTDYLRKKGTQPPQSPEAPRTAQSLTSTDKRTQIA